MACESIDPSDEETQELWDNLVDSAVRVGVASHNGDDVVLSKAFHDHINTMMEKGVMDTRLVIIWEQLDKRDMLSDSERDWMAIIGDFMTCNNKFNTVKEGDWHNTVMFVTAIFRDEIEELEEVEL